MDVSELGNSLRSPDQVGSVLIPVQDNDYTLYSNLFKNINGFTPPNQLSFVFGESDNEYEVIVDSFTKDRVKYNILKVIYNGIKYKINLSYMVSTIDWLIAQPENIAIRSITIDNF